MNIFKHTLGDSYGITELKIAGVPISVTNQYNGAVVYTLSEDTDELVEYEFLVVGTGDSATFTKKNLNDYTFLGTVSLYDGRLMWHVFYKSLAPTVVHLASATYTVKL